MQPLNSSAPEPTSSKIPALTRNYDLQDYTSAEDFIQAFKKYFLEIKDGKNFYLAQRNGVQLNFIDITSCIFQYTT